MSANERWVYRYFIFSSIKILDSGLSNKLIRLINVYLK